MVFNFAFTCLTSAPICFLVFLFGRPWLPVAVTEAASWAFIVLLPAGLIAMAADALMEYVQRRSQGLKNGKTDA